MDASLGICGGESEGFDKRTFSWITQQGTDPNTDGKLNQLPESLTDAIRIGNQEAGYGAACATQTIHIDSGHNLLKIMYALVLENPEGHPENKQTQFTIQLLGLHNEPLPYPVITVHGNDLMNQGLVRSKQPVCGHACFSNWLVKTIDVSPLSGKDIKIQFCVADCGMGNHYAYAYVATQLDQSIPDETADPPVSLLFIPNAFTPNGDGNNERFGPEGKSIIEFEMYIFNRWGQLIFESHALDSKWDGRIGTSGALADPGAYLWIIRATGEDGKLYKLTGEVTLLAN
ncbi:MAG: gliding motility-associated C-terminal domain-containing protein [Flavobacteriales bacterium]|nr:gliding motility-associated C-terminal domain-containing protein [Flavobacteriales bacterium]MCB9449478.1 gliding motility-associated C-terminal domain-containing protein [Flavobacteriales bacterium]